MMEEQHKLSDWVYHCIAIALLGEVYPNIRAITIKKSGSNVTLKYYLDREPISFDYESIEVVSTNLDAAMGTGWERLDVACTHHTGHLSEIERDEVIVYARREYDINSNSWRRVAGDAAESRLRKV